MLKLYYTDRSDAAIFKKYRLMVKNRIHHEFKDHLGLYYVVELGFLKKKDNF